MIETNQKQRDILLSILQDFDLNNQPRDFIKAVATFLDLEQPKIYQPNILADKIVHLYDHYKGQFDIYLTQLKFKQLNTDAKDFLWTVFKKYQQKANQRKFVMGQGKPMGIREHMNQPINSNTNQSMSMNMVNMFMDVPNFQTVQEIQIFQRKMFDLYKNFLPQVLNSIPMPLSSGPNQMYRGNPYQQYGMSGVGGLTGMAGMNSMPNMQGLGMSGLAGHSSMSAGMSGLSSSGLANSSNMNNPSSMTSLSGYSNKQDYYQPTYQNRYYFDNNKQIGGYGTNQQSQKTVPNDYRNHPMHMNGMGFNYCGDRFVPDQFRNSKHSDMMISNSRMNPTMEQFQRRQKQKNFGSVEDRRYDNPYQNYNLNQYSQLYNEKKISRNSERERQAPCTKQFASQQPRKMHKKDEQQQLNSEQQQQKKKSFKLNCTCVKQEQICYYCRCSNIDPFNEVYQVLLMQRITPQNSKISYAVSKKWLQKISKSSDRMDIEIRCIKMDKMSSDEICWPEKYSIKVDDQFVQNYITEKTSIKKRKQSSFVLIKSLGDDKLKQQTVNIGIQCKFVQQIDKPEICDYTLGIFVITKHTYQKMYEKTVSKMSEKNISTFIDKKQGDDERKQQLVLQTHEPSIRKLIKIPIRGKNCSHPECFDLEVFLSMLAIEHNRQWRCPICAKDAKELVIDNELKKILADISKMVKQPDEIVFYSDGSHDIRYKQEGQQKEKQSDSHEAEG